jgi:hypothetical protein
LNGESLANILGTTTGGLGGAGIDATGGSLANIAATLAEGNLARGRPHWRRRSDGRFSALFRQDRLL